ncbi:hypothetical protein PV10_08846 [Exophiala mesophila]|uniref:Maintenance of mitochondrial morphology protein 1 n=1 Tax=Exophiala mesophila TaxID=212818 RepID=A0A0D1Z3D0_EXOME|nr:uncharacterized protein PV10_08846 [Exophiala mesophila]KIV89267.1 hypothetical protein PV10_08846 [Exophiala mesophila]
MSTTLTFTQGLLLGQLSVVLLIGAFIKFFIFGEAPPIRNKPSSSQSQSHFHSRSQSTHRSKFPNPQHIRSPSLHSLASSRTSAQQQSLRNKASSTNVLRPVPTTATDIDSILRKTYYQIPSVSRFGSPQGASSHTTNGAGFGGKNSAGGVGAQSQHHHHHQQQHHNEHNHNHHSHHNKPHSTHQPESLDWFNVLTAQAIAQYRQTAYNLRDASSGGAPMILASLEAAMNNPDKRPSFIDQIKITEISMGEEFPIFSNVRVIAMEDDASSGPSGTGGRLQALMDVDLSDDNLTLAIETALILNYPKPFSAVLPVALAVSVVRFSGTLSISFVPATQDDPDTSDKQGSATSKPKTNLAFSFLPDYRLDLSVRSLIGSRTRLQDVPKIAQLVEARAQAWFEERVVEPRVQVVPLPGMWPRMGKVRVREGQEDERPPTQDEHRATSFPEKRETRPDDNFPSQEETERLFQGLRFRNGHVRSNSQAIVTEEDPPTPQPMMAMPGALPA